jgi:hypothetical protein
MPSQPSSNQRSQQLRPYGGDSAAGAARPPGVDVTGRLVQFVGDDEPRFWSYAGAPWDWMAIAQLFPVAERVPDGWLYTGYDVLLLLCVGRRES